MLETSLRAQFILEDQLARVLEYNQELVSLNSDLHKQVQNLKHGTGCNDVLEKATSGLGSTDTLDSILKRMRDASEKRKELEQQRAETQRLLREKQLEVRNEKNAGERAQSLELVEALQSKVRELDKKAELQNVLHEELMIEMAAIKKTQVAPTTGQMQWKPACKLSNQEVQTSPDSHPASPDFDSSRVDCMSRYAAYDTLYSYQHNLGLRSSGMMQRTHFVPSYQSTITTNSHNRPYTSLEPFSKTASLTRHRSLSNFSDPDHAFHSQQSSHQIWNDLPPKTAQPFDYPSRSMSQSNLPSRVNWSFEPKRNFWGFRQCDDFEYVPGGSELIHDGQYRKGVKKGRLGSVGGQRSVDRWKGSEGYPMSPPDYRLNNMGIDMFAFTDPRIDCNRQPYSTMLPTYSSKIDRAERLQSSSGQRVLLPGAESMEIDRIMAKIEQDNRVLAELDKSRANAGGLSATNLDLTRSSMVGTVLPLTSHLPLGMTTLLPSVGNPYYNPAPSTQSLLPLLNYGQSKRIMPPPPPAPTSAFEIEGTLAGLTVAEQAQLQQLVQQQPSTDNIGNPVPDMLDIPGKGRCYVYIARYTYDPFHQSINENPESELCCNAGEYLLVWGHVDEDGYCDAETLDGRRGLVPSNYIEKLVGDDLLEFHHNVVMHLREAEDCNSTTVPQDIDLGPHNTEFLGEGVYRRSEVTSYMDVEAEMLLDQDDHLDNNPDGPVPAPKQLTLERQLNKSVLIGWNHPDIPYPAPIESYHVYVDGVLKTTVKAVDRPRALVEGVDSNRPHRISVRSVTHNRRASRDAACTMVIGKDIPIGPTCVKASSITSTSAVISWLPSNSNHQHVVSVNNVQVRTVKPGVYRHTITGLAPNTVYRVSVRAKNIRAPHFDEKNPKQLERLSCHTDFRTLAKGTGLPEAPCDVQVEPGPQDGTLLVTWIPVTLNTLTPVTGYAVYADGKKVTDVDSPTGDHALIDIGKLIGLNPKHVTVRTKSRDSQSGDSAATSIPQHMLRGRMHAKEVEKPRYPAVAIHRRGTTHRTRVDQLGQTVIEPEENLSDKEVYPHMKIPAIEITKDSASEAAFSEDDFVDSRGMRGAQHGAYDHRHQGQGQIRGHDPRRPDRGRGGAPMQPRDRQGDPQQYYVDNRGVNQPPSRALHSRGGGQPPPTQHQPSRGSGDRKVRWFQAIFDYDPQAMSPNPEGCEEELPFALGDQIKVYGDADADGFFWGECKGRKGFVPHNMVAEITDTKQVVIDGRGAGSSSGQGSANQGGNDRWGDTYQNMPMRKMIALYDYDPHELSPNVDAEVELSFQTGDIIYVYGEMDEDGFYIGEVEGLRGLVPSNFLTDAPSDYGDGAGPSGRGGRGLGPGARGPPPPPRNDPAHNRRKDTCPSQHPRSQRGGMAAGRGQAGMDPQYPGHPGVMDPNDPRRGGRGRGGLQQGPPGALDPHQNQFNMPNQYLDNQQMSQNGQQLQQTQQQQQPQQRPIKGGPSVVPDFVIPNNKESPTQPQPQSNFLPQAAFQAPNIMGKLSELTSSGSGAVEAGADLLSKGKELIFMKFGLGGKS